MLLMEVRMDTVVPKDVVEKLGLPRESILILTKLSRWLKKSKKISTLMLGKIYLEY